MGIRNNKPETLERTIIGPVQSVALQLIASAALRLLVESSFKTRTIQPASTTKRAAYRFLIPCRLQEITNIKVLFAMYCFSIFIGSASRCQQK